MLFILNYLFIYIVNKIIKLFHAKSSKIIKFNCAIKISENFIVCVVYCFTPILYLIFCNLCFDSYENFVHHKIK